MDVLLTNDDGFDSDGLFALRRALEHLGHVTVVAPLEEKSGTSHAITYRDSIRVKRVHLRDGSPAWAVDGTPADCVKFAVLEALDAPPDLLVSGINLGLNVGVNLFYSGTVAAAVEGALQDIPSIAVSTECLPKLELTQIARRAVSTIDDYELADGGGPRAYNLNLPGGPNGHSKVVFTSPARRVYGERYRKQEESEEHSHFQLELLEEPSHTPETTTDVRAVRDGNISVTPLRPNFCDLDHLRSMEEDLTG